MLRFLNIVAILALVGSAVYAYSIKYQTSYRAEQIVKTKLEIKAEHDAIAVLRAEWSFMTRPERVQQLADRYLDLQPLTADKIETAHALPERAPHVDAIAAKIDMLGLGVASTPAADPGAAPTTPKTPPRRAPRRRRREQDIKDDDGRWANSRRADLGRQGRAPARGRARRNACARFARAAFSTNLARSTSRMRLVALLFLGLYGVIGGRLVLFGLQAGPRQFAPRRGRGGRRRASRSFSTATARFSRPT